jgi:hypothetical protein
LNNAFKVLLAKDPDEAAAATEDDDASVMQAEPDRLESKS